MLPEVTYVVRDHYSTKKDNIDIMLPEIAYVVETVTAPKKITLISCYQKLLML
jgi:uncharacterized protein YcbK (DUF882 family)